MITLQNLLDYSKAKGLSSELTGVCDSLKYNHLKLEETLNSSLPRYLDWDLGYKVSFGFEFKPNVWYWFSGMVEDNGSDLNMDLNLSFTQRFNRANGACQKTWSKGYECQIVIEEFLN